MLGEYDKILMYEGINPEVMRCIRRDIILEINSSEQVYRPTEIQEEMIKKGYDKFMISGALSYVVAEGKILVSSDMKLSAKKDLTGKLLEEKPIVPYFWEKDEIELYTGFEEMYSAHPEFSKIKGEKKHELLVGSVNIWAYHMGGKENVEELRDYLRMI